MLWIYNSFGGKGYKNLCGSDCVLLTFQNCSCHCSILTLNWQIYISKQTKKMVAHCNRINWKSLKWVLGCEFSSSNSATNTFWTSLHAIFSLRPAFPSHWTSFISCHLHSTLVLLLIFWLLFERLYNFFPWYYIAAYLSLPRLLYLNTKDWMASISISHSFTGKSKFKVLADSVWDESPLPGFQTVVLSLYPHVVEGKR